MTSAVGPRGPRIYNLFPLLAGPVHDWQRHLPRIARMGFNWIYVNPFHFPGFSGSLYAVKDYYRLNPMLRGNAYEADDVLLKNFIDSAAKYGLSVMMDLVINHTSKDAELTHQNPEFYARDETGALKSPSAIDPANSENVTVWGDLAEIDFTPRPELDGFVRYFQDVVKHYVKLGVRGFRCDAAYKVPAEIWLGISHAAHTINPDVMFFAETLGCREEEVEALRPARFDYLFNSAKWWDFKSPWLLDQYTRFRGIAGSIAFPESHDTPRFRQDLADRGITSVRAVEQQYKALYLFTATFSTGVMMPMGFEYGFEGSLHVVETRPEHWESPYFDISDFIWRVNQMRALVPPLNREGPQHQVWSPTGVTGLLRKDAEGGDWCLTVINPEPKGSWTLEGNGSDPLARIAMSGHEVTPGGRCGPGTGEAGLTAKAGDLRVFTGSGPTD
jgi:starch synthase (maltosyl-transferring)